MIQFITDPARLDEIAPHWHALAATTPHGAPDKTPCEIPHTGHPFHGPTWHRCWWDHYGLGSQLAVAVDRDDDGAVALVAPLMLQPRPFGGRIRFLASGSVCTDYASVLVARESHPEAMERLAVALESLVEDTTRWTHWQIELDGVDPSASWYPAFRAALLRRRYRVREEPIPSSYVATLPDSWPEFLATLHKSFRRKIKKHSQRFLDGAYTLRRTTATDQIPAALELLIRLHQQRRRAMGEPGSFSDPHLGPFLHTVIPRLFELGQSEIQWIEVDGQPLAAHLVLMHERTVSMYVSGIDPAVIAQEPGHMLVTASIHDAMQRGYRRFDFLRGDEPYKRLWTGRPIPLVRCHLTPPRTVSRAADSAGVWARRLKRHLKKGTHLFLET